MFFAILIFCLIAETLGKAVLTGIAIPIAAFELLSEQISSLF
jgi:hypothetical protein